jgi:hypothetical protein
MANRDDVLRRALLKITDSDLITWGTAVEGVLITGSPGSGKSSTVGAQLARSLLLTPKSGGLILTAKAEETEIWRGYARECGRENDLIVFSETSGHSFDPVHYEWSRKGRGAGDVENIVDFFNSLVELADSGKKKKRNRSGHSQPNSLKGTA